MIKKYTRDTGKTLKARIWKAPKAQVRDTRDAHATRSDQAQDECNASNAGGAHAHDARTTKKAQTADARYTYFDCLRDKPPVPGEANGTTLYQLLMVGCMVLFVFTANGVGKSGTSFLAQSH